MWNSATPGFQPSTTSLCVYDGWNLAATLNAQLSVLQSFVWGTDVNGSLSDAAGIGGLLLISDLGTNCCVGYDGIGNVVVLVNSADNSIAARYDYSPYGELLRKTGPLATDNPFRFSSKFCDDESGLVCYPHRFYSPQLGRWVSYDQGNDPQSPNLVCFVLNSPIGTIDPDGNLNLPIGARGPMVAALVAISDLFRAGNDFTSPEAKELRATGYEMLHVMEEVGGKTAKEAQRIKSASSFRYNRSITVGSDPNAWARKGKNFTKNGGRLLRNMFAAIAIGMAVDSSEQNAVAGATAHLAGDDSSSMAQMYRDIDRGDEGYADLDAVNAALESTGSTDEGALIAVAVNYYAGDVYSSPDSSHVDPEANCSADSNEMITIKQ